MSRKVTLALTGLGVIVLSLGLQLLPGRAAPVAQMTPFPTPTPGPDGRILYTVRPGDTLWRIAAITGLGLDEIRELNNLGPDDTLVPNQQLLLGLGGPVQENPTPGPTPTPTSLLPTPSAQPGAGSLCVLLFEDVNGDALRQEEEVPIPGGAISLTNREGSVSLTGTTTARFDADDEVIRDCFEGLEEGEYTITIALPEGYNPTTLLNHTLDLRAGDETLLDFGAQRNSETEAATPVEEGGRSPLLGLVGVLFLLAGLGLAFFAGRMRRQMTP